MNDLSGSFDVVTSKEDRKRLAMVRISMPVFEQLLKDISVEGLPEDAQLRAWRYDFESDSVKLQFHSKTFSMVPEGEVIPTMSLVTTNWKIHLKP